MRPTESGFVLKAFPFTIVFADAHEASRAEYIAAALALDVGAEIAADLDEAFAMAVVLRPALVVIGLGLTDDAGFDLARRLKSDPRTESIPLVGATSLVARTMAERAAEHGFVSLLTKPCSVELIARTIAHVTETHAPSPRTERSAAR